MQRPTVSVIIVNYRVKYFLAQTLLSVEKAFIGISREIIVVDNNSNDGSIEWIQHEFPDITIIANKQNVGFAKANNQAIKIASGDYTLILNPDTIISEKAIMDSIKWMKSHPKCGGIGTKMIDGNGVFLPESKRSFPTPWVSFCKIFGLIKLFPSSKIFARYNCGYLPNDKPNKIDILAGAYMLVRTPLLQKIGGFDESFFMYGEDIDLSYRISKEGFTNYYLPSPIIHYKGESTKKNSPHYVKVFYEAMEIFYKKHYPSYSPIFNMLVKSGIKLRADLEKLRMYIPKKNETNLEKDYIILSNHTDVNAKVSDSTTIKPSKFSVYRLKSNEIQNIILDNRDYSYQEIINFVNRYSAKDRYFHIYFSEYGKIMSPKMEKL